MLKKQRRLRTMKNFRHLFRKGRTTGSKFLVLKTLKRDDEDPTRFAFIISAKTEKSAVKRNKARRQLREVVRAELSKVRPGLDVAITIKKPFLELDFAEKEKEAKNVLKKANVIT